MPKYETNAALRSGVPPTLEQRLAAIRAMLQDANRIPSHHCLAFGADPWDLSPEGATRAAAAAAADWLGNLAKCLVEQGFDFDVVDELSFPQVGDEQRKQLG
jgi:hypothetical protein